MTTKRKDTTTKTRKGRRDEQKSLTTSPSRTLAAAADPRISRKVVALLNDETINKEARGNLRELFLDFTNAAAGAVLLHPTIAPLAFHLACENLPTLRARKDKFAAENAQSHLEMIINLVNTLPDPDLDAGLSDEERELADLQRDAEYFAALLEHRGWMSPHCKGALSDRVRECPSSI